MLVTAVTPAPAHFSGREVRAVEFVLWFIQTVAEAVIRYGVSKVLDYLFKRH